MDQIVQDIIDKVTGDNTYDCLEEQIKLHRPKRKMRQTFYKKIKNYQFLFFGDIKAPLKGVILFDNYNLL